MKHSLQERMELTRQALAHSDLTSREQRLLVALITYMPHEPSYGWDLRTGTLAQAIYAEDTRTARKNTSTTLRSLRAKGFVSTDENERGNRSQAANTYYVEWDRLCVYDFTAKSPDFSTKSRDVAVKSLDVSMKSGDFAVGVPLSTSQEPSKNQEAPTSQDPQVDEEVEEEFSAQELETERASEDRPSADGGPGEEGPSVLPVGGDCGQPGAGSAGDYNPAWTVEADTLCFRTDWDGTPSSDELSQLYRSFYDFDGRLARQTVESLADTYSHDPAEALPILRTHVEAVGAA
jgi:hypothetical protein